MKGRVTVRCAHCNAPKSLPLHQRGERNFCNRDCLNSWRRKSVTVKCAHCHTLKTIARSHQHSTNFCNRDCYDAYRTTQPERHASTSVGRRKADDPYYEARDNQTYAARRAAEDAEIARLQAHAAKIRANVHRDPWESR